METAYPRPATLSALLALDASRRAVGIADGLVPLEALAPQSWDYSAPTLTTKGWERYEEKRLCPDSATFAAEFYEAYPELKGVALDGLLVAGGAVGQFLARRGEKKRLWKAADVDIFVVGQASTADSQARLLEFIADLEAAAHRQGREAVRESLKKAEARHKPATSRARGRAEERFPSQEQDAASAAQACRHLLDGFGSLDFRPRAAGEARHHPVRPATISEGLWANLEAHVPALYYDLPEVSAVRTAGSVTIRGASCFQVVLRHYAAASEVLHGFDLGPAAVGFDGRQVWLTELGRFSYECACLVVDTGRRSLTYEARLAKYHDRGFSLVLPGLNVAALSRRNLKYGYNEVADLPGLPFAYSAVDGNRIEFDRFPKSFGPASDYGPEEEIDEDGDGGFSLAYMNLYRLVNGRADFIHAASGPGYGVAARVLTKAPHLTLEMVQSLYDRFRRSCWDGARLNTRTLERYLTVTSLGDLTSEVFAGGRPMGEALDAAFAAQRAEATRLWKLRIQEADHSALPWVTENPGGQQGPLTGSRSPVVEDPAAWYGEYLAAPPAAD